MMIEIVSALNDKREYFYFEKHLSFFQFFKKRDQPTGSEGLLHLHVLSIELIGLYMCVRPIIYYRRTKN